MNNNFIKKLLSISVVSVLFLMAVPFNSMQVGAAAPPTVITQGATAVSDDTATLNGNLTDTGTSTPVMIFFEYGTTNKYGSTTTVQTTSTTGEFNATITGLQPNTTYHFIAYAEDAASAVVSGGDMTFSTTSNPPLVNTSPASAITDTSVTLSGFLDSLGWATAVNVYIEYGITASYGTTVVAQTSTMTTPGAFSVNLTGLRPGTIYHFAAYIDGGTAGTATGADMTFTTVSNGSTPAVNTNAATSVSYFSATLNGTLTSLGMATSVNVYFNYGTSTNYGSTIAAQTPTMTASGAFIVNLTGLHPNTTYHFTAYTDGGISGICTGIDMSFKTAATSVPQVNTSAASGITATGAVLGGFLASLGTASAVNVYIEYGTTTSYGTTISAQNPIMTAAGAFSVNLTGLLSGTTYHFAAYADGGGSGTATGADMTFTPANNVSTLVANTNAATSVSYLSATLNGTLTSLGSATSVNVYFNYGTTTSYGAMIVAQPTTMTAAGAFSVNLTGLHPSTTYHFIAYADGGTSGMGTGIDMTFMTPATSVPQVNTSAASGITTTGAVLGGFLASLGTAAKVDVYVEYGLTNSYGTIIPTRTPTMTAAGLFSVNITGLRPGTSYHFAAYANGGLNGIATGADMTFTTLSMSLGVSTATATNTNSPNVTLNGNLVSLGTADTVKVSFEYGPTVAYGSTTAPQPVTAAGNFSAGISGLTAGSTYHFRADADGGVSGTANGADMTFFVSDSAGSSASTSGILNPAGVNAQGIFNQSAYTLSGDNNVILYVLGGTASETSTGTPLNQISIVHLATPPAIQTGAGMVTPAYDFTPSGTTFNPSVTLEFRYDPAKIPSGVAETNLQIAYFDTTKNAWVTLPSIVDTVNKIVAAQTTHFSAYAVTYGIKPVSMTNTTPTTTTATKKTTTTKTTAHAVTTTPVTPGKSSNITLIMIIAVVVLAVIGAVYFLMKKRAKSTKVVK